MNKGQNIEYHQNPNSLRLAYQNIPKTLLLKLVEKCYYTKK